MKPRVCILRTDGTNCDEETATAFRLAGADPVSVHVNQLRDQTERLSSFQILALSGGFSYGDDVASGVILANELATFLGDQLRTFVEMRKPIIGICNGFQVLVRTGLLPFAELGRQCVTLSVNRSGRFQCEWVELEVNHKSPCIFTVDLEDGLVLQNANGEGRFYADGDHFEDALGVMERRQLIALRYRSNPNGSCLDIAGICDQSGLIFGLMPHPERFVRAEQHPNWRRPGAPKPLGLRIFENAVRVVR